MLDDGHDVQDSDIHGWSLLHHALRCRDRRAPADRRASACRCNGVSSHSWRRPLGTIPPSRDSPSDGRESRLAWLAQGSRL
ncbi:hypothetical protein [Microbispora triticiradicis]|uniref:hypothetical protein n=1 Tax=Microbispora triticiradicis TaxID=2200763 RepID=UPI0027DB9D96|nr:hypothetical protein [Microbispora triticiradicis]